MKYDVLKAFFTAQTRARLSLSFSEIARQAKTRLPSSAFDHPAWWANDSKSHVQAKAWLEAGYRAENIDLDAQRVEFVRVAPAPARGVREMQKTYVHEPGPPYKVHPAYGALKGTFTIDPSWDLANPVFDEEELAEWDASLERKANLIEEGLRRKK